MACRRLATDHTDYANLYVLYFVAVTGYVPNPTGSAPNSLTGFVSNPFFTLNFFNLTGIRPNLTGYMLDLFGLNFFNLTGTRPIPTGCLLDPFGYLLNLADCASLGNH